MLDDRRIRSLLLTTCLSAALLPTAATAQDYETVVVATRNETSAFAAPRAVEVIDGDEMEDTGATAIPDALDTASGVMIQRTNPGAGSPVMRGLIGPQNLILVDGVRFNTSIFRTGPNQYLSTFDIHAVDRIEVVRGPSSVLYGNGAMGGVLQLLTFDPQRQSPGWHQRARTFFRSADTATGGALRVAQHEGAFSSMAGVDYQSSSDIAAGGGLGQPHTGFRTGGWRTRLSVHPPSLPFTVTGAYFGSRVADAGRTDKLGQGDIRFYDNEDHLAYVSFSMRGKRVLEELKATISYHRMIDGTDRFRCPTGDDDRALDLIGCQSLDPDDLDRRQRYLDVVDTIGADLGAALSVFARRLRLNLGADAYRDAVGSSMKEARAQDGFVFEPAERGNFSDGSSYGTVGIYAHGDLQIWDFGRGGSLRANGGGRFSYFKAFAPAVPGLGDVDYSYSGAVGSGGLQWLRTDLFNIWASFAQGFRAPNLQETTVLGNTGSKFEIPNDDLGPERSNTIEAGTRISASPLVLEAVWFRSYLLDVIDEESASWNGLTEIDGAPVIRRVNTARGIYQGVEGSAALSIWRFNLSGGAMWIRGDLTNQDGTYPARRVPPFSGSAALRYEHPDRSFDLGLFTRWAVRQDRLHPSDESDLRICEDGYHTGLLRTQCNGTPGWVTLDLRGGLRPTEELRLQLSVENITDRRYKTHGSGFYQAGRSAYAVIIVEL